MDRGSGEQRVTARAIIIATVVAVAAAVITPYTAYVARTWHFGWGTLPNGPVVIAFVLVAANGLMLRLWASRALTRADVLIIYSIATAKERRQRARETVAASCSETLTRSRT